MGGFDPTAFLGDGVAGVAGHGDGPAAPEPQAEPAENRDVWRDTSGSVASAATVAAPCELTLDKPFAADLNRLFCQPESARYAGDAWERLLKAICSFTDLYAQAAVDAGWSARELFAIHRQAFLSDSDPATHRSALRQFRAPSVCFTVGKREIVDITPDAITLIADRHGTRSRMMREHNPINHNPRAYGLVWEVPLF